MYHLLLSLILVIVASIAQAGTLYWVGGDGDWGDPLNWAHGSGASSCGCVPTEDDDVIFDQASFTAPQGSVTVSSAAYCRDIIWTFAPAWSSFSGDAPLYCHGSFTLAPELAWNYTGDIHFLSNTPGRTITTAGKVIDSRIIFNGAGGWELQDAFTMAAGVAPHWKAMRLVQGDLSFNGHPVTVNSFISDHDMPRSLSLGGSLVTILAQGLVYFNGQPLYTWRLGGEGLEFDAGSSHILLGAHKTSFNGGGYQYHKVSLAGNVNNLQAEAGPNTIHRLEMKNGTIHGTHIFDQLFLDGTSFTVGHLHANESIHISSASCHGQLQLLGATIGGGGFTMAGGSVQVNNALIGRMTVTGGASFIATNSVDLGENEGWTFLSQGSQTLYWVGNSGNWSQGDHWSHSSGGPVSGCVPNQYTNVVFDGNSFSSPGHTVTMDEASHSRDLVWSTGNMAPVWAGGWQQLNIHGSLDISSSLTISYGAAINFKGTNGAYTIRTGNNLLRSDLIFNGGNATWTLLDSLCNSQLGTSLQRRIHIQNGTLNTNDHYVLTQAFICSGSEGPGLLLGSSTVELSGGSLSPFSQWTMAHANTYLEASEATIRMLAAAGTFSGGGKSYGRLEVNGNGTLLDTLSNNTTIQELVFHGNGNIIGSHIINDLWMTSGRSYTLDGISTLAGSIMSSGDCILPVHINGGGFFKNNGVVEVYHAQLGNVQATGDASFIAYNSFDLGGSSGWIIEEPVPQTLYWIGNGGQWNETANWSAVSGGPPVSCLPTPNDDVVFDANSFNGPDQVVQVSQGSTANLHAHCRNMTWDLEQPARLQGSWLNIHGSVILHPLLSVPGGSWRFRSTMPGNTLQTQGVIINGSLHFSGDGGEWTLLDSLQMSGNSAMVELGRGILNTNGQFLKIRHFRSLDSGFSRNLVMTGSTVEIMSPVPPPSPPLPVTNPKQWEVEGNGLTLEADNSEIRFTAAFGYNPTTQEFYGGGKTYGHVNFTAATIPVNIRQEDGPCHFHHLEMAVNGRFLGQHSHDTLTLYPGRTYRLHQLQTLTGVLNANGTCGQPIRIDGWAYGGFHKETGTVNVDHVWLNYVPATGGAQFNGTNTSNIWMSPGWNLQPVVPKTLYKINTFSWDSPSGWSFTSGGTPAGCIPSMYDDVIFDDASFPNNATTFNLSDAAYCRNMTWATSQVTPTFQNNHYSGLLYLYGSLDLSQGLTFKIPTVYFRADNMGNTITTGGVSLGSILRFQGEGEWILQDALHTHWWNDTNSGNELYHNKGKLNTNGQHVLLKRFESGPSSAGAQRQLLLGSSTIELKGSSNIHWRVLDNDILFDAGTSLITFTGSSGTFTGGDGLAYNKVLGANPAANISVAGSNDGISHTTFEEVEFQGSGRIWGLCEMELLRVAPGKSMTRFGTEPLRVNSLHAIGTPSEPILLKAYASSSLEVDGGLVCVEHCTIEDLQAQGGAEFRAANSVSIGNTAGWNFVACADIAAMSYENGAFCPGAEITFHNTSEGMVEGQSWSFPGGMPSTSEDPSPVVTYPEPGSYSVTLTTYFADGEQTIVNEKWVEVSTTPTIEVVVTWEELTAPSGGTSYQWLDCNNGMLPIEGETGQTLMPVSNGMYAVTMETPYCSATSDCFPYITTGLPSRVVGSEIVVRPNPNTGSFVVDVPEQFRNGVISIIDATGRNVAGPFMHHQGNVIDVAVRPGLYFLRLMLDDQVIGTRLIIE